MWALPSSPLPSCSLREPQWTSGFLPLRMRARLLKQAFERVAELLDKIMHQQRRDWVARASSFASRLRRLRCGLRGNLLELRLVGLGEPTGAFDRNDSKGTIAAIATSGSLFSSKLS
jgi:hypothetical protein